jgi:hypothetical protein
MQSVCVLDTHLLGFSIDNPLNPKSHVTALTWLGSAHSVLAIIHAHSAILISLAPLAHGKLCQPYRCLGKISTDSQIFAIAASQSMQNVLVATSNADVMCYGCTPSAADMQAELQQLWVHGMPTSQHLLAVCPATGACAASAAPASNEISVWRFSATKSCAQHSVEDIQAPCPCTCLAFRPDMRQQLPEHHAPSVPVPALLMAAGQDNCVRIWVDIDLSVALSQQAIAATNAGSAQPVRRAMCLSQVLIPHPSLSTGPSLLTVSWADPSQITMDRSICQHHRVGWLVAMLVALDAAHDCPKQEDPEDANVDHAEEADIVTGQLEELYVWAICLEGLQPLSDVEVTEDPGLQQLAGNAVCHTPSVTASLWGTHCQQVP